MIELKVVTQQVTIDGRRSDSVLTGYVEPGDVVALLPRSMRHLDGEHVAITEVQLRNGSAFNTVGPPDEIHQRLAAGRGMA
jgi:hypothetical protein